MAKGSKQPLAELVDEIPILDDFFEEHSIPEYIDDSTFLDPDPMLKMTVDGLFDTEHSKRPLDDFPLPDQCYERQSTVGYGDGSSVMLPPSGLLGDDQAEVDYPQMASVNIHSDIIMRDSVFQEDDILEEVNYSSFTPPRPIPYTAKQYQNDDETCFSYASTWEGSDWLASEDTTYVRIISSLTTMA